MTDSERYNMLLAELAEIIQEKNFTISILRQETSLLEQKLKDAEAIIKVYESGQREEHVKS